MIRNTLWALLAAVTICSCDKDDDDDDNDINQTDREFTLRAGMGNTAEIDAGTLASQKGEEPGIREFGSMMVADHTDAQTKLKTLSMQLGLYAPDSLDTEHAALKAQLSSLSGRAFDSVYIHAQVRDHDRTIELFENEVDDGDNRRLRDYANETLPHLRHHKEMADSIAAQYQPR